ncbi:hypothetical protein KA119_02785 [Candidatus Gracilibacteria bacterium]|nr:hypothetical protein [Candidatus Gracilibacteria bacterium]
MASVEESLKKLSGEVYENVKTGVLDKFKLNEKTFKPEDFVGGKLKPEVLEPLKKELKEKAGGAKLDLTGVLVSAGLTQSPDDLPTVIDFFVERAVKNLEEKIEKELAGFSSFTAVQVVPQDLLQFGVKVVDGVVKGEEGTNEKKPEGNLDDATKAEQEKRLISEAEEKENIKKAIGAAGPLGWIASKLLFGKRKDKDGNDLPSYIDEAYKNPDSMFGAILGLFGVPRFSESWKKMANPEGMPVQVKGFFENIEKAVAPHREKVVKALEKVEVVDDRKFNVVRFREAVVTTDGEFVKGVESDFVLSEDLDFVDANQDMKVKVVLPEGMSLDIPKKGHYQVRYNAINGDLDSNTPKDGASLAASKGEIYIYKLPAGTKFPKGAKIERYEEA